MNLCIRIDEDGGLTPVELNQSLIYHVLPDPTIVGAIPHLFCCALASAESSGRVNAHGLGEYIEANVRGVIYLIGSDENGEAIDLQVDKVISCLEK